MDDHPGIYSARARSVEDALLNGSHWLPDVGPDEWLACDFQ